MDSALDRIQDAKNAVELRKQMSEEQEIFGDLSSLKSVILVGAADEGIRFVDLLTKLGITIEMICDDNAKMQGKKVFGFDVKSTTCLAECDKSTPVLVASHRPLKAVQKLKEHGFAVTAQTMVLQVLHPEIFPPHMFYERWFEDLHNHSSELVWLNEKLGDEKSRLHLEQILKYRLSGNIKHLEEIVDWEVYKPSDLIELAHDEVYVDGGAYDGDTIRLFIDRVDNRFEKIFAFEPDPETHQRLIKNFAEDDRVQAFNKGLYSSEVELRFSNNQERASVIMEDGEIVIDCSSLDIIAAGERVTFIKMNIEGAELAALVGAKRTINDWKPKLAISAYHRPSDLWEVPKQILELNPDYEVYVRQQDVGVIETVCYAI